MMNWFLMFTNPNWKKSETGEKGNGKCLYYGCAFRSRSRHGIELAGGTLNNSRFKIQYSILGFSLAPGIYFKEENATNANKKTFGNNSGGL